MNYFINKNPFVSYNTLGELPTFKFLFDTLDSGFNRLDAIKNISESKPQLLQLINNTKSDTINNFKKSASEVSDSVKGSIKNIGKTISDSIFKNLNAMEGHVNWTADKVKAAGESWTTGPLGMVYKYDENGNIIGTFKSGEKVSPEFAIENAKRYYTKSFNEWKDYLKGLPDVNQDRLDALVAASGGTVASKKHLMKYVKDHWGDWDAIDKFWRNFATTASGNGKRMPGLVLRRQLEADWFKGIHKDWSWYLQNRKQFGV